MDVHISADMFLQAMGLEKVWDTEPVAGGTALRDSGLTTILEAALASARSRERYGFTLSRISSHLLCCQDHEAEALLVVLV